MSQDPLPNAGDQLFRQSELLFRALIENTRDVIGMLAVDGTILYVSPSTRQFGHDPSDMVGRKAGFLVHPDDRETVEQALAEAAEEPGCTVRVEHRSRDTDGNWRHKQTLLHNMLQVPAVRAIVANIHDVTALKETEADLQELNMNLWSEIQRREQAEEEIRQSEQRFRNMIQDQTEFIVRWLPDGTRTFVNAAYCRFFGKSESELLGQSFLPQILNEEDRQQVLRLAAGLTAENPIASYEHQVLLPDGSIGWTQWIDRAIFDQDGQVVEYQSVGRDTTAQKRAEERLQQQQDELAHVARLSVMGEMVAAMGHELGQPLHTISTFASAARRALEGDHPDRIEKVLDWTAKIQQHVTRADKVIRRLLGFTRADPSDRLLMGVNDVVHASIELSETDLRRRTVKLQLDLASDLPAVRVDSVQIEQVLINLLRNAAEAMDDNGRDDRLVTLTTCLTDDGQVCVRVRDCGSGMTDESYRRLFEAFYTTKPEGAGIGLAISRRIIEEHEGQLEAERNSDRGMTFWFTLPTA